MKYYILLSLQHVQEGDIVEGGVIQQIQEVEQIKDPSGSNILIMNDGEEQTLSTLANMASEAPVVHLE